MTWPASLLLGPDFAPLGDRPVPVGPLGTTLNLILEPGAELDPEATLRILPVPGEAPIASAAITSDLGPLDPKRPVAWVIAEWDGGRAVSGIEIKTPAKAADDGLRARIKARVQGVWLPLVPTDLVPVGTAQSIPAVAAEALMAELVTPAKFNGQTIPGAWEGAPTAIESVLVKAGRQPSGLSVAVADRPPFFSRAGLVPSAGIEIPGLAGAIAGLPGETGAGRTVPIRLTSTGAGEVTVALQGGTSHVIRQLPGVQAGALPVPWEGPGLCPVRLGPGAELIEALCRPQADLLTQRRWLPHEAALPTGRAQLCGRGIAVAQGFEPIPPGSGLAGIDLMVQRRSDRGSVTVALHPDRHGRPAPSPYPGDPLRIDWKGSTADADPVWLGADLGRPLALADEPWWLIVASAQGELLWALAHPAPQASLGCLYRDRDGQWQKPCAGTTGYWAMTRVRITAPGSAIGAITLGRGDQEVPWSADPGQPGRLRASVADLAVLNRARDAETLMIRVAADSAGSVTLSDLRLVWR